MLNVNLATVIEAQTTFPELLWLAGTDPQLPQTVTVKYGNGDGVALPVQRNNVTADDFRHFGAITT